jgi:hypothetical protein
VLYICSFAYFASVASILTTSAILGIGAGILWTAQGHFLTINSSDATRGRDGGLFWYVCMYVPM